VTGHFDIASSTDPAIRSWAIDLIAARNGEKDGYSFLQFNQLCASPREAIKVFHRRSVCSCLKDIYYNFKDNTRKQTLCNCCKKITDAKNICVCDCGLGIYRSRECAKRDWKSHKNECKAYNG
jgi:hypothetical protein